MNTSRISVVSRPPYTSLRVAREALPPGARPSIPRCARWKPRSSSHSASSTWPASSVETSFWYLRLSWSSAGQPLRLGQHVGHALDAEQGAQRAHHRPAERLRADARSGTSGGRTTPRAARRRGADDAPLKRRPIGHAGFAEQPLEPRVREPRASRRAALGRPVEIRVPVGDDRDEREPLTGLLWIGHRVGRGQRSSCSGSATVSASGSAGPSGRTGKQSVRPLEDLACSATNSSERV